MEQGKYEPIEYPTMLAAIDDQRIMTVKRKEGGFNLMENCDRYYSLDVTPDQLRALARELYTLADSP